MFLTADNDTSKEMNYWTLLLTKCKVAWYIISVMSVCLSVCLSVIDENVQILVIVTISKSNKNNVITVTETKLILFN